MKRNYKIDILKAFAIILVLVGHSIQYGQGHEFYYNTLFFNNIIFKIIYSFHMPLFILISGYLTYCSLNSKNDNAIKLIFKKIKTLLIPILVWSIIPFVLSVRNMVNLNLLFLIKRYILVANDNLWFLWALLFISIIVILVNKKFKDNIFVYLIIFLLTFITPDVYNLSLYKYMYPFFMIGYLICKYNFVNVIIKNKIAICFSLLLFVLMIIFFKPDIYVYVGGVSVLHKNIFRQLLFDTYRIVLAIVGCHIFISISVYFIDYMSDKVKNIFVFIGKNTMGIYIISDMIFKYILGEITYNLYNINYFVVILESMLILIICLVLVKLISKNKFLNNILLGGR